MEQAQRITVVAAGADRLSPSERITQALEWDAIAGEPTKLRIPVHIYDRATKSYQQIPDAAWSVSLSGLTSQQVEEFIKRVGAAIVAVATASEGEQP